MASAAERPAEALIAYAYQRPREVMLKSSSVRMLSAGRRICWHTLSMAVTFESTTRTTIGMTELFDLSRSIDAHQNSMARSREKAVGGVTSGLISQGQEVTWRAWHFGLPIRMTSRITEMQGPHYFVDEQVRGPFLRFRHVHEFSEVPAGTVMVDRIDFAAPFGLLGRFAERLFLARYLRKLIETRNLHLTAGARAE
jgi:ligand-binding SRPBCC domain-containing protein